MEKYNEINPLNWSIDDNGNISLLDDEGNIVDTIYTQSLVDNFLEENKDNEIIIH